MFPLNKVSPETLLFTDHQKPNQQIQQQIQQQIHNEPLMNIGDNTTLGGLSQYSQSSLELFSQPFHLLSQNSNNSTISTNHLTATGSQFTAAKNDKTMSEKSNRKKTKYYTKYISQTQENNKTQESGYHSYQTWNSERQESKENNRVIDEVVKVTKECTQQIQSTVCDLKDSLKVELDKQSSLQEQQQYDKMFFTEQQMKQLHETVNSIHINYSNKDQLNDLNKKMNECCERFDVLELQLKSFILTSETRFEKLCSLMESLRNEACHSTVVSTAQLDAPADSSNITAVVVPDTIELATPHAIELTTPQSTAVMANSSELYSQCDKVQQNEPLTVSSEVNLSHSILTDTTTATNRRDSTTIRDTSIRDTTIRDTTIRDTSIRDTSIRDTSIRDTSISQRDTKGTSRVCPAIVTSNRKKRRPIPQTIIIDDKENICKRLRSSDNKKPLSEQSLNITTATSIIKTEKESPSGFSPPFIVSPPNTTSSLHQTSAKQSFQRSNELLKRQAFIKTMAPDSDDILKEIQSVIIRNKH